jgi:hypothetical protein
MKQLMGIEANDTDRDDELSLFLQMSGDAAEKYIDNKIALDTVTENHSRSLTPVALRYWPAGTVSEVLVDGVDKTADWETFLDPGIQWAASSRSSASRSSSFDQLSITYEAGYEPLPNDLAYVIVRTAATYDTHGGGVAGAITKETVVGVGSIEYANNDNAPGSVGMLSPVSIGTLDMYRRMYV